MSSLLSYQNYVITKENKKKSSLLSIKLVYKRATQL